MSDQDLEDLCKLIGNQEGEKIKKFYEDQENGDRNS